MMGGIAKPTIGVSGPVQSAVLRCVDAGAPGFGDKLPVCATVS